MVPYGFIGAGNMAEAIMSGMLKTQFCVPEDIMIYDINTSRCGELAATLGVQVAADPQILAGEAETVILAVKPDRIGAVIGDLAMPLGNRLTISIAAGVKLQALQGVLGEEARVVRVMPNTPALVLKGASAFAASPSCTAADRETARGIFGSVGVCHELEEKHLDAVTALSGSGPAYCFLALEALADGGVRCGLPRAVAQELAAATMEGAAAMVLEGNRHPGQLKDMVCSPGGTTIEGVTALEDRGVRAAFIDAVAAAWQRSRELGE